MKKFVATNKQRHFFRIIFAFIIALFVNNYFASTHQGWLPFTTVLVMMTTTGSAFYQGLMRFLLMVVIVTIASCLFSTIDNFYLRINDVLLGAVLGIFVNLVIFPDRVDVEFRKAVITILDAYADYFSAMINCLLRIDNNKAEETKKVVEEHLQKLPGWVNEVGFDLFLQKGYRYFFMKIGQAGEILFAMHPIVRHPFAEELLEIVRQPLLECALKVEQFFAALTTVLDLRKLIEGVVDFSEDIALIEKEIIAIMPVNALELWESSKEAIYFTELIQDLRDLRDVLLKLGIALR